MTDNKLKNKLKVNNKVNIIEKYRKYSEYY